MKVLAKNYVEKISSASPLQLVIINYQIILDYLNCSKYYIKTSKEDYIFNIKKARIFLGKLKESLNMEYEISTRLMISYNYIDKILAYALFNKNINYINKSIEILKKLLNSWEIIQMYEKNQELSSININYNEDNLKREFKA